MGLNLDGLEKLRWGQVSFIFEERQKKQGNHKMHTLLFRFKNCKSVTNFSETHEFNNNSLKANWILLISGDYSTIFTESEVNNCFSIIAQMLSNFVANLICCWNFEEMQGSHLEILCPCYNVLHKVITAWYDVILNQLKCANLYNHWSNYTKVKLSQ